MTSLRAWREAQQLTLAEVGALTGLSESYLSRVERGERDVSPLTKVAIARRLGAHLGELFPVTKLPSHSEKAS